MAGGAPRDVPSTRRSYQAGGHYGCCHLGNEAVYVRLRGFEPLQKEQMALHHAAHHSCIIRAEVAEHCGLSRQQATRPLQPLLASGEVTRHRVGKGT